MKPLAGDPHPRVRLEVVRVASFFRGKSGVEAAGIALEVLKKPTDYYLDYTLGETTPRHAALPQHFLYFLPLPQGHGSLRPALGPSRTTGGPLISSPSTNTQRLLWRRKVASSR
jgi:hypothetical protein